MKLVIGGAGQQKLSLMREAYDLGVICDGAGCTDEEIRTCDTLDHLHLWVRRKLEAGESPAECLLALLPAHAVVFCDEIGCGIVPASGFERRLREEVGRLLCTLAQGAEEVVRITCGIKTHIKGGGKDA